MPFVCIIIFLSCLFALLQVCVRIASKPCLVQALT
jgi:hypothetical protein